jgi:hypothetical protein
LASSAIDEQLASRGLARGDPFDSLSALIQGEAETVRFNRGGQPVVIDTPPLVQLQAIREYFRLTLGI